MVPKPQIKSVEILAFDRSDGAQCDIEAKKEGVDYLDEMADTMILNEEGKEEIVICMKFQSLKMMT